MKSKIVIGLVCFIAGMAVVYIYDLNWKNTKLDQVNDLVGYFSEGYDIHEQMIGNCVSSLNSTISCYTNNSQKCDYKDLDLKINENSKQFDALKIKLSAVDNNTERVIKTAMDIN